MYEALMQFIAVYYLHVSSLESLVQMLNSMGALALTSVNACGACVYLIHSFNSPSIHSLIVVHTFLITVTLIVVRTFLITLNVGFARDGDLNIT